MCCIAQLAPSAARGYLSRRFVSFSSMTSEFARTERAVTRRRAAGKVRPNKWWIPTYGYDQTTIASSPHAPCAALGTGLCIRDFTCKHDLSDSPRGWMAMDSINIRQGYMCNLFTAQAPTSIASAPSSTTTSFSVSMVERKTGVVPLAKLNDWLAYGRGFGHS